MRRCCGRRCGSSASGRGRRGGHGAAGHAGVPRPLSGTELLQRKGLRPDTPHWRGNAQNSPANVRNHRNNRQHRAAALGGLLLAGL